jgi:hypothetical protein
MRSVRSLLAQSPAVAISLVALVFAMGTGAGYAATSASGTTTRITFHNLRLHGHWQGHLKYGVSGGVVYLAGSAGNSNGNRISMTTLPPAERPTRQLDLTINLGGLGTGVIQVTPDGQISAFAEGGVNNFTFVSLDGVSFPLGS